MLKSGNIGPTGTKLPEPDLLLLSYTGCFTFMKWFELLKQEYDCPVVMLHVPYQPDGDITPEMRRYVVEQLEREVIPRSRSVAGQEARPRRARPPPRALGAGRGRSGRGVGVGAPPAVAHRRLLRRRLLHRPDLQRRSAAPRTRRLYYRELRAEVEERIAAGEGPDDARRPMRRGEVPPRRRGAAELDHLLRLLAHVQPRGRDRRREHLHARRRPLRHRLPPRPERPARDPRRLLPRLLHEPRPADARRSCSSATSTTTRPTASSSTA